MRLKAWFHSAFGPLIASAALCALPSLARAQLVTTLVDRDGVSVPCVTVGPLAPIAQEYCVRRTLAQGFVLKTELGVSGLTVATQGDEDGAVTAVAANSPAAQAGLKVGDRLVSVDGAAVQRTPTSVAEQRSFGARDAPIRLTVRRGGETVELAFRRGPAPEPADAPKSPNFLVGVHPMVNWQGLFVPCMGAGPLGPAVIAGCQSHYARDGFVRANGLGATGLSFQDGTGGTALVSAVAEGSAALAAGARVGDQVVSIDGAPLKASLGQSAQALIFGKAGDSRRLIVERDGRPMSVDLVLASR